MTTKQSEPTKEAVIRAWAERHGFEDHPMSTLGPAFDDARFDDDRMRLLEIEKAAREFIGMWDYLRGAVPLEAEVVHHLRALLESEVKK